MPINVTQSTLPEANTDSYKYSLSFRQKAAERILTSYLRLSTRQYLKLKSVEIPTVPKPQPGHSYVLYVHVPFCESLCPYCSFNRFILNEGKAHDYFKSLRQEMRMVAALGYSFTSMYIGGGTPTILPDELVKTIDLAKELFGIEEVSCETNPNHLTPAMVDLLKDRVQRLSVGVQSFDDTLLTQMNRCEKFGSGDEILRRIQETAPHFKSLNVDMIFNFPLQTPEVLFADIQKVIQSGAQQATFYPLMSSPSVATSLRKNLGEMNFEREGVYYNIVQETLAKHFTPVSAWTFRRKDTKMIDEYIVDSEEYVGIGTGVFSYVGGTLYVSTFSLKEYQQRIASGRMGIIAHQVYNFHAQMRYQLMTGLFGLHCDPHEFRERFGVSPWRGLWLEMLFLKASGAFKENGKVTLNGFGRYISVVIMREFFSGVNRLRDAARKGLTLEELD